MTIRKSLLPLAAGALVTCVFVPGAGAQQPAPPASIATATVAQPAPAETPLVTIDDVRARLDKGAKITFVDARGAIDGDMVKGAVHVTISDVDAWAKDVAKDTQIVTYCACPTDGGAKGVASRLIALGFTHVAALHGGIGAWKTAGLPTEVAR
jgi:rhodanese-related sulfurtransferase